MSESPDPWAKALIDKLITTPWELQEFMRSPYDIGEYAYPRQTLLELHAHFVITDDPRARWLST